MSNLSQSKKLLNIKVVNKHSDSDQKCWVVSTLLLSSTLVICIYLGINEIPKTVKSLPVQTTRVERNIIVTESEMHPSGEKLSVEFQDLSNEINKNSREYLKQKLSEKFKPNKKIEIKPDINQVPQNIDQQANNQESEKDFSPPMGNLDTGKIAPQSSIEFTLKIEEQNPVVENKSEGHNISDENMPLYNFGEVRSFESQTLCLDAMTKDNSVVTLYECHGQGGNQHWEINDNQEMRKGSFCADYFGGSILMFQCHSMKGNQLWKYDTSKRTIHHPNSNTCLTITHDVKLGMKPCKEISSQRWMWKGVYPNSHAIFNNEL